MNRRLSLKDLCQISACPNCKQALVLEYDKNAVCKHCGEEYNWFSGSWHLIPSRYRSSSDLWETWEQLQANGLIPYLKNPEVNLAVVENPMTAAFTEFCNFRGKILDVGCGPQAWPSYFGFRTTSVQFFGVDPLIDQEGSRYVQLRALGEFLPFLDSAFDQVIFATSLDHFIDPVTILKEATRVLNSSGCINIWLGEKSPDTPPPPSSPDWYRDLQKPDKAEDLFHFRRLFDKDMSNIISRSSLKVEEKNVLPINEYRRNLFYRVVRR